MAHLPRLALRSGAHARQALVARSFAQPQHVRAISSSKPAKDAHAGHHGESASHDEYPPEGFSAPIWRNTILTLIAGVTLYRVSMLHADPHPSPASSSGRSAPGNESDDNTHDEDKRPFLTRYMDYYFTPASFWKERNERHLDLAREKAEERLLFQDAERPPVHRLRYTGTFEQASPHGICPGSQIDLSDLKIKNASE